MPETKKAFIIRDFNDAGTGASFNAGEVRDIEQGAFDNYRAAGLVRAEGDTEDHSVLDQHEAA